MKNNDDLYKVIEYENPYYMEYNDDILIPLKEYIFNSQAKAYKFLKSYYTGDDEYNDRCHGENNWYVERVSDTFITLNSKSDGLIEAVSMVAVYDERNGK